MFLMVVSSGSVVLCGVDNLLLMIFFFIFSFMVKKKMAINLLFIYSSNGLEKLFFLIEIFIGVFYKLKQVGDRGELAYIKVIIMDRISKILFDDLLWINCWKGVVMD